MFKKRSFLASVLLSQVGSLNLWGPRFPVMSPEGDGGNAGGGAGAGGEGGGAGGNNNSSNGGQGGNNNQPDIQAQLATMQEQLLNLTKENNQLKTQVSKGSSNDLAQQIANESDPAKVSKLLKSALESTQEENKKLKKSIVTSNIRSTLQRIAGEKVHDVADILNQPEFREILGSSLDSEKMDIDETIASAAIDKLLQKKPYLMKSAQPPGTINNKPGQTNKGKAVSEMTEAEIMAELKKVW